MLTETVHAVTMGKHVRSGRGPLFSALATEYAEKHTAHKAPLSKTALLNGLRQDKVLIGMGFTPHDLRRTASTNWQKMGISKEVRDAMRNHVAAGVGRVYDRYSYEQENREAFDVWGERLRSIITSEAHSTTL